MTEQENEQDGDADQSVTPPTQAQLYDDLRRIGQLEDQKLSIQNEINERTERLRNAIPQLDAGSLLYQILSSTLKNAPRAGKAKKTTTSRRTSKKTTKRKRG